MAFETVLAIPPADRQSQQTFYHCGPASCENILLSLGIDVDELQLAREARTHEGGTDWIGQLAEVLRAHAHHMDWLTVEMPNDPATPAQKEDLWQNVCASICEAGAPVLANVVAPVFNYPKGSYKNAGQNPGYGGGTVYHYIVIIGVAEDEAGVRHYLVLDSGFSLPNGSRVWWVSHDQMATLIPPKGYVFAKPHLVGVPTLPGPARDEADMLAFAMGESLSIDRYRALLPAVKDALAKSQCTNPRRVAEWLAQIGHESGGLRYLEELADGSAYEWREDLGNNQPGDGPRYKGRSAIQVTGRSNYGQLSRWAFDNNLVPTPTYFVDQPEELGTDTFGFVGAAWYWVVARGDQINEAADREDHERVCMLINGGYHGLEDRVNRYQWAMECGAAQAFVPQEPQYQPPPVETVGQHARPDTPLTGRPYHHSQPESTDSQLLNIRAEGLLTQALVFAIAERAGIDAREVYDRVRDSF